MTSRDLAESNGSVEIVVNDPNDCTGELKRIGGSDSDSWNNTLANQVVQALWMNSSDASYLETQYKAVAAAMVGIAPQDELEGMIAAQLIAAHSASMECYRRAMIPDQPFLGRRENLNQASKLSKTWASLLEALNRHRGKGQQKMTVEYVHVHQGGQAVVGVVESSGRMKEGGSEKSGEQPLAK